MVFAHYFPKNNSVGSIIVVEMGGEAACCIFSGMFGCKLAEIKYYIFGICIVVDAAGMCVGSVQCRLFPSE